MCPNQVQFSFSLGYQELREAYDFAHRSELRLARYGGVLLIVVGGIVTVVDWKTLNAVGITMIFAGGYVLARNLRNLRKWYDDEKIQSAIFEATIAETGVVTKSATSSGQFEWNHFTGYRETPAAMVLFYAHNYITFPKSALAAQQLADLKAILAAHLEPVSDKPEKATKFQILVVIIVLALAVYFLVTSAEDFWSHSHYFKT